MRKNKKEQSREKPGPTMQETLMNERKRYADEWSSSADAFARDGHYEWMASFLPGQGRVLEIGTGNGRSTIAIARKGHSVVSVDENPLCLEFAEKNLQDAGISVTRVERQGFNATPSGYQLSHRRIDLPFPEQGVALLEGDVFKDPDNRGHCIDRALERWLLHGPRFDVITCWLVGTHGARARNVAVAKRRVSHSGEYRLAVQNYIYEMADTLLRPGGFLHIVDRGEVAGDSLLLADALSGHMEQASVTSLRVRLELPQREYTDPAGGVKMMFTQPLSGRKVKMDKMYLTSIIADKPTLSDTSRA